MWEEAGGTWKVPHRQRGKQKEVGRGWNGITTSFLWDNSTNHSYHRRQINALFSFLFLLELSMLRGIRPVYHSLLCFALLCFERRYNFGSDLIGHSQAAPAQGDSKCTLDLRASSRPCMVISTTASVSLYRLQTKTQSRFCKQKRVTVPLKSEEWLSGCAIALLSPPVFIKVCGPDSLLHPQWLCHPQVFKYILLCFNVLWCNS